jgi:hypothetical protein
MAWRSILAVVAGPDLIWTIGRIGVADPLLTLASPAHASSPNKDPFHTYVTAAGGPFATGAQGGRPAHPSPRLGLPKSQQDGG